MPDGRTPEVDAYWREYCQRADVEPDQRLDVYAFGSSPEMADRLLDIVLNGPKRATAGLFEDFDGEDAEELPLVGTYCVLLDGQDRPAAVVRTTDVEIKPLREVDAAFAWDEGEGDRSLDYWMTVHRNYFTRQLANHGRTFTDDMPVVLERFELLWPEPDKPGRGSE